MMKSTSRTWHVKQQRRSVLEQKNNKQRRNRNRKRFHTVKYCRTLLTCTARGSMPGTNVAMPLASRLLNASLQRTNNTGTVSGWRTKQECKTDRRHTQSIPVIQSLLFSPSLEGHTLDNRRTALGLCI